MASDDTPSDWSWWARPRPNPLSALLPADFVAWANRAPGSDPRLAAVADTTSANIGRPWMMNAGLDALQAMAGGPIERAGIAVGDALDSTGRALGFSVPQQAPITADQLAQRARAFYDQKMAPTTFPLNAMLLLTDKASGTPIERAGIAVTDTLDSVGRALGFNVPSQAPISAREFRDKVQAADDATVHAVARTVKSYLPHAPTWFRDARASADQPVTVADAPPLHHDADIETLASLPEADLARIGDWYDRNIDAAFAALPRWFGWDRNSGRQR